MSDRQTFAYGGTALTYNPGRHSIFVVGHDWYQAATTTRSAASSHVSQQSGDGTAPLIHVFRVRR